jgi:hypothetical protein
MLDFNFPNCEMLKKLTVFKDFSPEDWRNFQMELNNPFKTMSLTKFQARNIVGIKVNLLR